jgi:putative spermidine/putrescine transport system permease protein/mannopine transport system permease protein
VPFVVLPVLASLLSIDPALRQSAEIMGAKPPRIFFSITLPLSVPGIVAALSTTTVMSLGFFVVPALLGGRQDMMMANLVDFYTRETLDWHAASAIGVILLAIVALVSIPAFWLRRDVAA